MSRCSRGLERLAPQQLRHVAGEARGLADEELLERRQAVDQAEADVAHQPQHVGVVGEQRFSPSVATPIAMVSKRRQR